MATVRQDDGEAFLELYGRPTRGQLNVRRGETFGIMEDTPVLHQSDALRVIASKYLRLAKDTKDRSDRRKFFDYAMLYAQLSEQSERRGTSRAMPGGDRKRADVSEPGDVSERGDGFARPHGR